MKKLILTILIMIWVIEPSIAIAAKKSTHKKHSKHTVTHVVHKKTRHKVVASKTHAGKKYSKLNHKKSLHKKMVHTAAAIPNVHPAVIVEKEITEAKPAFGFMASMKHHLVQYVHKTVSTLRYSVYKMGGTKFDVSRGIYVVDCSDYVDNILEEVYPNAFINLVNSTGSDKPTTEHYYDFFNGLDGDSSRYWTKVNDVDQLEAGDVLVFRYKNSYGATRGGHVMVVMDKPTPDGDGYLVRVADSAPSGHSEDTRRGRVSGIGIGTLVLKTNPDTGEPAAYAWKVGASWKSNVKIAMARPIGN